MLDLMYHIPSQRKLKEFVVNEEWLKITRSASAPRCSRRLVSHARYRVSARATPGIPKHKFVETKLLW